VTTQSLAPNLYLRLFPSHWLDSPKQAIKRLADAIIVFIGGA
jgi:hypothetical protein